MSYQRMIIGLKEGLPPVLLESSHYLLLRFFPILPLLFSLPVILGFYLSKECLNFSTGVKGNIYIFFYVYVYMYMCIYMYFMYIYIYVHVYTCIYTYVCITRKTCLMLEIFLLWCWVKLLPLELLLSPKPVPHLNYHLTGSGGTFLLAP
jgi:hypothetical protein